MLKREDAIVIGDRMDTDVRCGLESEIDTLLVLSGITDRNGIDQFPYRPRYILNGIIDLVNLINCMEIQDKYKSERKEVARFMRRLYKHGLTTTSGGNISLRLSDDIILITPSATDKGRMKWKEVGIMNIFGENLTPDLKPSIETEMHLSIYRKKNEDAGNCSCSSGLRFTFHSNKSKNKYQSYS